MDMTSSFSRSLTLLLEDIPASMRHPNRRWAREDRGTSGDQQLKSESASRGKS